MAPFFSIVTSTFNAADTFAALLESLAGQTCRDFELIVQDGGSKDETIQILERHRPLLPFVSYMSESDNGIYDAWNKALPRIKGEWVLFLGADDRLAEADVLASAKALLVTLPPAVRFACCPVSVVANNDTSAERREPEKDPEKALQTTMEGALPACHTGMFHKADIFSLARFDPSFRIAGDYDFFARTMVSPAHYHALALDLVLMGDGGISTLPQTALPLRWEYLRGLARSYPRCISFSRTLLPVLKGSLVHILCIVLGNARAAMLLDRIRMARGLPARWSKAVTSSRPTLVKKQSNGEPPLVSIIIPAYNVAPWIAATLHSVLAQTLEHWECIIINDGSTDATTDIAKSFSDPRITVVDRKNAGVSEARNHGLHMASGDYVVFLDADDIWTPDALERLVGALETSPEADLSWAKCVRFVDGTSEALPMPGTYVCHSGNAWHDMLVDNFMPFGTLCVRATTAKKYLFDHTIRICEDRDWLLRVLKGRKAVHIPHVVHYYRQRKGSAMRDVQRFIADEESVMQKHLAEPDIPQNIRKQALSALKFHQGILLAKGQGQRVAAVKVFLSAFTTAPLYWENYLRCIRKIASKISPKRYISLIKEYEGK